jgi:hypothetical protein
MRLSKIKSLLFQGPLLLPKAGRDGNQYHTYTPPILKLFKFDPKTFCVSVDKNNETQKSRIGILCIWIWKLLGNSELACR